MLEAKSVIDDQSQAELRLLLEKLPAGAYACDPDGLITYFNQRAVELWGRAPKVNDPEDRFCGSFSLLAADGSPIRHEQCWMALALQENREYNGQEIVIERPDGRRTTVLAHANPLHDEQGHLTGAVNVLVDITDRKGAEEARAHLAAIVASSQDAILSKTLDGVITSWNRGAERLYGYTAEEVVGQPVSLLVPPDLPDEIPAILARLRRGERVENYETVRVAKDGRRIDVWLTVSPVRTVDGRLIGASAVARDITERKRLEQSQRLLVAAGATLSSSLDYATTLQQVARLAVPGLADRCVLVLCDGKGTVTPVAVADVEPHNETHLQEVLRGAPVEAAAWRDLVQVIRSGQSALYPVIAPEPHASLVRDGNALQLWQHAPTVSAMIVPLPARGKILGALAFAAGGSGRAYTAEDLALAEELGRRCALAIDNASLHREAQAALRLRNDVLASVTHDLKNPLAGISVTAQLLERLLRSGGQPADQLAYHADRIYKRAQSMALQLNELLDVAALEAGEALDLQLQPTDLVALVRQLTVDAQGTTERHEIRVVAEAEELIGQWDRSRLERVLRNLLSNAVSYSDEGRAITVSVYGQEDTSQRWAVISMRDEGIGIPASDLATIFEPFRRGTNVAGQIIGAGLGLTGARRIIEQHGGTIAIASQEGVGTAVTLRLPLAVE